MAITLTVGTDSYISVSDADAYFAKRLFVDDWETATADTKAKALIMATEKIDMQPLRGIKSVSSQTLQFPRAIYSEVFPTLKSNIVGVNLNGDGWVVEEEVSQIVKDATCEEALSIIIGGSQAHTRAELQRQGVKSYSLGGLSETLTGRDTGYALQSVKAVQLLRRYLGGGRMIV